MQIYLNLDSTIPTTTEKHKAGKPFTSSVRNDLQDCLLWVQPGLINPDGIGKFIWKAPAYRMCPISCAFLHRRLAEQTHGKDWWLHLVSLTAYRLAPTTRYGFNGRCSTDASFLKVES